MRSVTLWFCLLAIIFGGACHSPSTLRHAQTQGARAWDNAALPSLVQGPSLHYVLSYRPKQLWSAWKDSPLMSVVPEERFLKIQERMGFDPRLNSEALYLRYHQASLSMLRLSPQSNVHSVTDAFRLILLPPVHKSSPNPDIYRVVGTHPSKRRVSLLVLRSDSESILAEDSMDGDEEEREQRVACVSYPCASPPQAGDSANAEVPTRKKRLGHHPTLASLALALGKLKPERSLLHMPWYKPHEAGRSAALARLVAPCPLSTWMRLPGDSVLAQPPKIFEECDSFRIELDGLSAEDIRLQLAWRGRWGRDSAKAEQEIRSLFLRLQNSDLGAMFSLSTHASLHVSSDDEAVHAVVTLSTARVSKALARLFATDLRRILE